MKSNKIIATIKQYFWLILCIFWCLYMGVSTYKDLWHVGKDDDVYTTTNGAAYDSENDIVYVTDNIDSYGFAYAIDSKNRVKAFFDADQYATGTYCDDLYYQDGRLFTLIHANTSLNNFPIKAYIFLELDPESMKVLGHTGWFTPYEEIRVSMISHDGVNFYMVGVSEDDSKAEVYAVSMGDLVSVSRSDNPNVRSVSTIRYSAMVEPSEGYHFVHAEYQDGQLTTLENGNGILSDAIYSQFVRDRFEDKQFTPDQVFLINKTTIIQSFFVALAGILFILAMHFFVKKRNRVAYMIVLWESMLAFVLFFTSVNLYEWNTMTDWDDMIFFSTFVLDDVRGELDELEAQYINTDDYYRTEDYRNISNRLRKVVMEYGEGKVFTNALCISAKNGDYHVIAAARGLDNCDIDKIYGTNAAWIVDEVHQDGTRTKTNITVDGTEYSLVCIGSEEDVNPTAMVMAILNTEETEVYSQVSIVLVVMISVVIFLIGSAIGIYILLRQAKDLKLLGTTMLDVSQGGIGIAKPDTLGEDMSDMWSGLLDIDRSFKNLNYIKYRTFEAYYKFAPKSVEKLLGKTSITEVGSGDAVRKRGTIVLMQTDTNSMLKGLSKSNAVSGPIVLENKAVEVLEAISKHQEEGRMYKISGSSDFSEMQLLMPETTTNASGIGTELSRIYKEEGYKACMFMHFTDYLYGVAIAGEEAAQFLLSGDIIRIHDQIKFLNELNLGQVITNTVYDREMEKPNCRYIGYWELESEGKMDLYEILDVYDDTTRHRREDTKPIFEEGLKYFYDSNFAMARNSFAKVLKLDYADTVARWYLFTCEKFIDGSGNKKDYSLSE